MIESSGNYVWAETATKFYNTVRVMGWFSNRADQVVSVDVVADGLLAQTTSLGPEQTESTPGQRFVVQYMTSAEGIAPHHLLVFTTASGQRVEVSVLALAEDAVSGFRSKRIWERYKAWLLELGPIRILEVGGRDRSGSASRNEYPAAEYVTLDIVPGDEVDIVADAHDLRSALDAASFDAFIAISVFEHLMMPWAVVGELNAVLRTGGLGFVLTHQSIGMHDMPWDFWRFSDTAWDALFNRYTGFEIIERELNDPNYILPMAFRPGQEGAENAAGFEVSAVIVRKTGPCTMTWPLTPAQLVDTHYPQ
jgi:hypothetical protein